MSEYPSDGMFQTSSTRPPGFNTTIDPAIFSPHLSQTNPAKWTYQKVVECIYAFEKSLDNDHELGARLVSSVSDVTLYISDVGYYDPHMISFCGSSEGGEKLQLLQHVSQLSVFLVAIQRRGEEPVRIGLKLKRAAEEEG